MPHRPSAAIRPGARELLPGVAAEEDEGVGEVAAIGIPDPQWGERPLLLIVGAEGFDWSSVEEALGSVFDAEVAAGKLSKWAVPKDIRFVTEIAKTSVGKIDKKALRARLT